MADCFRCGASGENTQLHSVISSKGIIKLCSNCAAMEGLPIIKKPTEAQLNPVYRHVSVKDRLANMSSRAHPSRQDVSLRDLIDKKFKDRGIQAHPDLIDNFHWTIQQIKRVKRITREQFAKGIGESEATVRMIEQGFLPENDYKIVNKIEGFLGISLRKTGKSGFSGNLQSAPKQFILDNSLVSKEEQQQKELPRKFSSNEINQLKIADLRDMKKKQEDKSKSSKTESWEEEYSQDDERFLDQKEEEDFEDDFEDEK